MVTSTTTIDILRHGRTQMDNVLRGRTDVPLSEDGYQQMSVALNLEAIKKPVWSSIITSPLQRCAHFATDLAQQHETPIHINEGFLEIDFGDWDGRHFAELKEESPVLFNQLWRQPHKYSPPNGETFSAFNQRVSSAWQQLIQQHNGQHILLICHGGVIRALLSQIMQMPAEALSRIEVPYACLSRVKIYHHNNEQDWPQLVFHNPTLTDEILHETLD